MGAPPTMPPVNEVRTASGTADTVRGTPKRNSGRCSRELLHERGGWNRAKPGALQQPHQEFKGETEGVRPGKASQDPGAGGIAQCGVVAVDDAQQAGLTQGNGPSLPRCSAGEENDRRGRSARLRAGLPPDEFAFCGEDAADVGESDSLLESPTGRDRG